MGSRNGSSLWYVSSGRRARSRFPLGPSELEVPSAGEEKVVLITAYTARRMPQGFTSRRMCEAEQTKIPPLFSFGDKKTR
jgi:hypothetical protein